MATLINVKIMLKICVEEIILKPEIVWRCKYHMGGVNLSAPQ